MANNWPNFDTVSDMHDGTPDISSALIAASSVHGPIAANWHLPPASSEERDGGGGGGTSATSADTSPNQAVNQEENSASTSTGGGAAENQSAQSPAGTDAAGGQESTPAWQPNVQYTWNSPGPSPTNAFDASGAGGSTQGSGSSSPVGLDGGLNSLQPEVNSILQPQSHILGNLTIAGVSSFVTNVPIAKILSTEAVRNALPTEQKIFADPSLRYVAYSLLAVGAQSYLYSRVHSKLLMPTGIDSIAFSLPWLVNDTPWRIGLTAGIWAAGALYNEFFTGHKAAVNTNALNQLENDEKTRTQSSMESAISACQQLGGVDEPILRQYYLDWTQPGQQFQDPLGGSRGAAILSIAWANTVLQKGTIEPNTSTAQYVLGGLNLDLGGAALIALLQAKNYLAEAKTDTQKSIGKQDNGSVVQQSEIAGLNSVESYVDSIINTEIYGKHNIPEAISQLQSYFKNNEGSATNLLTDIESDITSYHNNKSDTQFVAKLYRDMALFDLAFCDYKLQGRDAADAAIALVGSPQYQSNGDGVPNGAMQALAMAQQLDPKNPDLPQLISIAYGLKEKLPTALQNQQSNTVLNPLQNSLS